MALSSQSPFNSKAFMETTYRAELDTSFTPVPDGEYMAQLMNINVKVIQSDRFEGGAGLGFEGQWQLIEDNYGNCRHAAEVVGIPRPMVRQQFLMDVVDPSKILLGNAALDTGKNRNIRLGLLLQVAGLNKKAGWRMNQLLNIMAGIRVGQGRPNADGETYPEVKNVISVEEWNRRQAERTAAIQANGGGTQSAAA